MVKITDNKKGGVSIDDTNKFMEDIESRVYNEFVNKEIFILNQNKLSNEEFKVLYDNEYSRYKKELKKLLRTAYKNVFNPLKTLEGLEYIWYKYIFIGVLNEEYVEGQRNRMYSSMNTPSLDIRNKVDKIKQKINKRFKK